MLHEQGRGAGEGWPGPWGESPGTAQAAPRTCSWYGICTREPRSACSAPPPPTPSSPPSTPACAPPKPSLRAPPPLRPPPSPPPLAQAPLPPPRFGAPSANLLPERWGSATPCPSLWRSSPWVRPGHTAACPAPGSDAQVCSRASGVFPPAEGPSRIEGATKWRPQQLGSQRRWRLGTREAHPWW